MIRPDSATALSQFSSGYDIGNAIDGSGLPSGFTPSSVHATYASGNHWTTASNAINNGTAKATFVFNSDVTIGTYYMWNHLSNGIASNGLYAVTRFDLVLKDSGNNVLYSMLNQSALPNVHTAQSFGFVPVSGVRTVEFSILANGQPTNNSYTGVAEVAFDTEAVPEPFTLGVLGLSLFGLAKRRKK
ncbi:MAG: PEP-CTERM sorting domain-containing protein [Fimbriimonadaceae bacterium]|nr:MAG: PEP-CTERM sorting domain-containing protein [Fimbriimonadaceae bacterium]